MLRIVLVSHMCRVSDMESIEMIFEHRRSTCRVSNQDVVSSMSHRAFPRQHYLTINARNAGFANARLASF